jgi:hypothetical protein
MAAVPGLSLAPTSVVYAQSSGGGGGEDKDGDGVPNSSDRCPNTSHPRCFKEGTTTTTTPTSEPRDPTPGKCPSPGYAFTIDEGEQGSNTDCFATLDDCNRDREEYINTYHPPASGEGSITDCQWNPGL